MLGGDGEIPDPVPSVAVIPVGDDLVLGDKLARKLGVYINDEITLISPNGKVTAFGTVPRIKAYRVIGMFNMGMYEYDANYVFMPLEAAQTYFGLKDAVSVIDVSLKDENDLVKVRDMLKKSVSLEAYVYDWKQTNAAFFNAIDVERNVMFLILTLIILVAAFNIITGLIMLVKDKSRDVAVLRTMGATRAMIMRIFFMDGAFIGVVGTTFGVILGLLFCHNIENIRQFLQPFRPRIVFVRNLFPVAASGQSRQYGSFVGGGNYSGAVFPCYHLSGVSCVEV